MTNTYTDVENRSNWPPGPWDGEPDKVTWVDPATDLDCMIRRGGGGAWCGYVGVPPGHPWHGKDYDDCPADVHGGLTYSGLCDDEGDERSAICHVPEPGRPVNVWWLGFDCGNSCDVMPGRDYTYDWGTYRDEAYVRAETLSFAQQAAAVSS